MDRGGGAVLALPEAHLETCTYFCPMGASLLTNGILIRVIRTNKTHVHIHNLPIPLPNHWVVKLILFPALTSCQLVILPGHIKFHQV